MRARLNLEDVPLLGRELDEHVQILTAERRQLPLEAVGRLQELAGRFE